MNWQKFWQKKSIFNYLLLPLSAVFLIIVTIRRHLFKIGFLKSYKSEAPVVIIGNISVGGAGKTPLVIALGELLEKHNIEYAVISKGYGGNYQNDNEWKEVYKSSKANDVGDEPLLIKTKLNCPLFVAKDRFEATKLVKHYYPNTKIILADDGLQHYKLQRDLEIAVISGKQQLGNRFLLPAGSLRELPSRLNSVDYVVSSGDTSCPFHYILRFRYWVHINTGEMKYHDDFMGDVTQNLAISGIANPDNFFNTVSELGFEYQHQSYPDHYQYTGEEMPKNKTILMTEKDWVKLKEFKHDDAWYLYTEAVVNENFESEFIKECSNF